MGYSLAYWTEVTDSVLSVLLLTSNVALIIYKSGKLEGHDFVQDSHHWCRHFFCVLSVVSPAGTYFLKADANLQH